MKHKSYSQSHGLILSIGKWSGSEEVPIFVARVMWENGKIFEEIFHVLELIAGVTEIT